MKPLGEPVIVWSPIKSGFSWMRGIRGRLMLLTLFLTILVVIVSHSLLYLTLSNQLFEVVDHELNEEFQEYVRAAENSGIKNSRELTEFSRFYFKNSAYKGFLRVKRMMLILTPEGYVASDKDALELRTTPKNVSGQKMASQDIYTFVNEGGHRLRTKSGPVIIDGRRLGTLRIAEWLHPIYNLLATTFISLGAGMIVTMLIALSIGFFVSQRILAPVSRMADVAEAITKEDLSQRINYRGSGDEISRLAQTFDSMVNRLEKAFNEQKQFISDASHELRTPITIIKGHLEILKLMNNPSKEDYQEALFVVLDELERMNRLVNNLLLLARSATSGFLVYENMNLRDFLESIYVKADKLADRRWILDKVPSVVFQGDHDRLTEVLLNLLQNAAEYTSRRDDTIKLGAKVNGDWVTIEVSDSGSGIPNYEQDNIFKRFYRLDKARSKTGGGAGLGLSLVDAIVRAHGGRVEVKSKRGQGSTFSVWLPIKPNQFAACALTKSAKKL